MQMSIGSFLGKPLAEEICMALDATRIEGEGSCAVQESLGLPVNLGSVLEEFCGKRPGHPDVLSVGNGQHCVPPVRWQSVQWVITPLLLLKCVDLIHN